MKESGRDNIITLGRIDGKGAVGRALHGIADFLKSPSSCLTYSTLKFIRSTCGKSTALQRWPSVQIPNFCSL